jgi:hypothetical protein
MMLQHDKLESANYMAGWVKNNVEKAGSAQ